MFFGHWECTDGFKAGGFSLAVINHRWLLSTYLSLFFSFLFPFLFPLLPPCLVNHTLKYERKQRGGGEGMLAVARPTRFLRGSYSNGLNSKGILESISRGLWTRKVKIHFGNTYVLLERGKRKIQVGRDSSSRFEGWANVRKTLCIIYEFSFCAFA